MIVHSSLLPMQKSDGKAITMTGLDFEVQPNDSAVASGQDRPDNNAIISEEIQPNDNAIASDQDRPNDNGMLFEEAQPNDNPLAPNQDQPNDTAMISEDVQPNDNTIASNQHSPNDNADASAPEGIPEVSSAWNCQFYYLPLLKRVSHL
jgi:hypothetical protein